MRLFCNIKIRDVSLGAEVNLQITFLSDED
jgi:hypothetical protein